MSKDKDEVVTAVRARLDDLEADWAARLQEIEPESPDRLVIEAIGIGRAQIIIAVRALLDDLQADEAIAQSRSRRRFRCQKPGQSAPGVG